MSRPVLSLEGVTRTYQTPHGDLTVLRGVDLQLMPGEIVGMVGPSGSGKSSLLHAAGLLEAPDAGRITVLDQDCTDMTDRARTALRRRSLGFVYQFHHLLPEFTALENAAMPLRIGATPVEEAKTAASAVLSHLGLAERLDHQPGALSGGEQQRVAIARALVHTPAAVLADEPTGNLDPETTDRVFAAFVEAARASRVACLIATHNLALTPKMDRVLRLEAGQLVEG